jgi:hypothetical protein
LRRTYGEWRSGYVHRFQYQRSGAHNAKLRNADRRGGNQTAKIEKMTEAEPIVSSNPPKSSLFPEEFFNNIGRMLPDAVNSRSRPTGDADEWPHPGGLRR